MPTFTCFTRDDRYSVPSLTFWAAKDEADMRALARQDLSANPHHEAVEVRDGDRLLFVEERRPPSRPRLWLLRA